MEAKDDNHHGPAPRTHRRGIYLLPNLLTTGAMFGGFYAILSAMNGHFEHAAIAIFVAMFFDGLDGQVARMTNTQSDFGVQYDSLSDMVSFGVAPAVLSFSWMLHSLGKVGWAAAFIYASCAALRLARFNTQIATVDKRYFIGLASPTAAALVAGLVWNGYDVEPNSGTAILAALMTSLAGILMVSNFRYKSLKGLDLKGKVPFMVIIGIVLVLVVISIDPAAMLLLLALTYTLSAPVFWLIRWFRNRQQATKAATNEYFESDDDLAGEMDEEAPESRQEHRFSSWFGSRKSVKAKTPVRERMEPEYNPPSYDRDVDPPILLDEESQDSEPTEESSSDGSANPWQNTRE